MSKKSTIKIVCETPELKQGFMEVMLLSKGQLAQFLGQSLSSKGIKSDIKITIAKDELTITQKSGDKGIVLVSSGVGYSTAGYDTLPDFDKYMVVRDGGVSVYVKTPDNVDAHLARFADLDEAVANIQSNDIVDAVNNIRKTYTVEETKTAVMNVVEEVGDTSATV